MKTRGAACSRGAEEIDAALLRAIAPIIHFLLRRVLGVTILRLQLPPELFPIAVDLGELVVGELAPLLFDLA